ncbi:MAG: hypothetical protein ACK5N8_05095 [Alphaproteobacteria bacterium]
MQIKKYKGMILTLAIIVLCAITMNDAKAAVHFIEKKDGAYDDPNQKPCQMMRYTIRSSDCTLNRTLYDKCPNGNYWRSCRCDINKYKFHIGNCSADMLGGEICNNTQYTECGCNETKFPYTKDNCESPKILAGSTNCNNTHYPECKRPDTFKTCPAGMIGSGESCDGKYKKCVCDPSIYKECNYGPASNAKKCTEENGALKYSSCDTPTCNADEVNADTYFDGKLNHFMNISGARLVGSIKCIKLPTCESFGYKASNTCGTHEMLNCPFDLSKKFCPMNKKAVTCADGGYVDSIPSGQECTSVSYEGKSCYKDCKSSCKPTVNCSWGC